MGSDWIDSDWIEWHGVGVTPLPWDVIKVRHRDGVEHPDGSGNFRWTHINSPSDIVAYKRRSSHDHQAESQAYGDAFLSSAHLRPVMPAPKFANVLVSKISDGLDVSPQQLLTGGPSDYYSVHVTEPIRKERPAYTAECGDIIEALGMTFNEGECFKALWRSCSARALGKGKPGTDAVYDAEKMAYYAQRVLAQRKGGLA